MSLLLAVVQATVTPTPSVSPEIVTQVVKTVQQVPVVPESVLQLFQLLGLAIAGALTSIVHLAVERGKLPGNVNRLLFTLYSVGAGVTVMALSHQFKLDAAGLVTGLTAFVAFLGSTQGQKMLSDFLAGLVSKTRVDESGAVVSLASDGPEAAV